MSTQTVSTETHETAPTRFVEANGIRFAYRRFGGGEGLPMLFCQHFTGTMDNWDAIITNTLAQEREVILFDNRGVGSSSGQTPDSVQAMATDALAFVDALGLKQIDLLGFSIGGMVAQQMVLGERYGRLKEIKQPTLVFNGINDVMIPTINSYILAQHIPDARLVLYPDSGHGALAQYSEQFCAEVNALLVRADASATKGRMIK